MQSVKRDLSAADIVMTRSRQKEKHIMLTIKITIELYMKVLKILFYIRYLFVVSVQYLCIKLFWNSNTRYLKVQYHDLVDYYVIRIWNANIHTLLEYIDQPICRENMAEKGADLYSSPNSPLALQLFCWNAKRYILWSAYAQINAVYFSVTYWFNRKLSLKHGEPA